MLVRYVTEDIVNYALLGAGYFCIPLNVLEAFCRMYLLGKYLRNSTFNHGYGAKPMVNIQINLVILEGLRILPFTLLNESH